MRKPRTSATSNALAPTLVSLFSGCGGLDIGLQRAGFELRACVDSMEDACESLRLNGVAATILNADIKDVSSEDILSAARLKRGELDLLAGGPPCPPFSKSRFYRKEKPRALDDPTTNTVHEYLRMLGDLLPGAFLFENVAGFAYKVHSDAMKLVEGHAHRLGYTITHKVVNAADYGVPQIRQRLFVVGLRNREPFLFPKPTHQESPEDIALFPLSRWVTAGDVIGDLDSAAAASDDGHRAGGRHHDLLVLVPPGENYLFFTAERGHPSPHFKWRSRYWSFLLKLSPEKPSWTIQARRSNNMGPFHWRNRILRLEEVRRLQTFPDHWKLAGTVDSAWRQLGNAVPPTLAEALGRQIARHLTLRSDGMSA